MNSLKDEHIRHSFYGLIVLSTFLFCLGLFLCAWQTQTVKEMLLAQDRDIASSLLDQGVSPDVIASALSSSQGSELGENLLSQLGFTEKTPSRFLPNISRFESATFLYILLGIVAFVSSLFTLFFAFHAKREGLYHQAISIIRSFLKGDFTTHLPRSYEGTLFQLFANVDNLASALQTKGEEEYKAKIFLKDTISDISHQLKTPLTALNMYNEIIKSEPNNPTTITEFSQKSMLALSRMEQLIQSLLKIARLDSQNIMFEKESLLMFDLVKQAIEELTVRASNEGKQIIISGKKDIQVHCDLQWTREALENIIKNALDHTSTGGHIYISWGSSLAMVRVSISDDGVGIDPEEIHHVFKRFYRSKNSKNVQGVGLGLSLAKSIVEGQGGLLSVQSTADFGTTFTMSFLTEM